MPPCDPLPAERCSVQVNEEAILQPVSNEQAEEIHLAPQQRAVDALIRGLAERAPGFNVAVIGRRGCGRTSTAMALARQEARRRPSAGDLVLLPNQRWPLEPRPARLPTSTGPAFVRALEELHSTLAGVTHEILEGRTRNRLQVEIHREQSAGERVLHEELSKVATTYGLALIVSDDGFDFVPLDDNDDDDRSEHKPALQDESESSASAEQDPQNGAHRPATDSAEQDPTDIGASAPPNDTASTGAPARPDNTTNAAASAPREPAQNDAHDRSEPAPQDEDDNGVSHRFVTVLDDLRPHVEETQRQLALLEAESASHLLQRQRESLRNAFAECFAGIPESALSTPQVRSFISELHDYLIQLFQLDSTLATPPPLTEIPRGLVIPTLLTTCERGSAAPLVQARNVSLASLFGRSIAAPTTESRYPEPGTFLAGDIHRANGGFLVIDADSLIKRERVYEHLKGCLLAHAIQPHEEADEGHALRIQPIELDLKVLLVADPDLIAQLQDLDPEFSRLFKIRAGFTEDMPLSEALTVYPGVAHWLHLHRGLPPCSREGLRELIQYGARLTEDQERVSTNVGLLSDLIAEAAAIAAPGESLRADHFRSARATVQERHGQMRDKLIDLYRNGSLRVELRGSRVGQVNGLAVISDGFQAVGRPCRVTAVTYAGTQGTLNIDREVEMSGPIHSKGMMILSGYLYDRFARTEPIVFGASVVFEQTYMPIEGDSASSAELFAILSSLAQAPARQDLGITGSVDQRGRILPVGGVNEKIEGFFDLCRAEGLTGTQGVVIPHTNVRTLILRPDVIEAIAARRFFIWPIATVEEGVELLMGTPAGADDLDEDDALALGAQRFPTDTVYGRIERRLGRLREAQSTARQRPCP